MQRRPQEQGKIREKVNHTQEPKIKRKHRKFETKKKSKKERQREGVKNKKRQGRNCLQKEINNKTRKSHGKGGKTKPHKKKHHNLYKQSEHIEIRNGKETQQG